MANDISSGAEQLLELAGKPLLWNGLSVSPLEVVGAKYLQKIRKKFQTVEEKEFVLGVTEVLRFIFLATQTDSNLFFPGNRLLDEIWHELILETSNYRKLCAYFKTDSFVDHTGITYDDYCAEADPAKIQEEQLSWLASYVNSFGEISAESAQLLPLSTAIANRMNVDLNGLNRIAITLTKLSQMDEASQPLSLEDYLRDRIAPQANQIASSSEAMKEAILDFFEFMRLLKPSTPNLIERDEFEKIWGASIAFAFTLAQHFAAFERLSDAAEWQQKNCEKWSALSRAQSLFGLATTHLAKPDRTSLRGTRTDSGYLINGTVPWCTGFGIFSDLVIGFVTADEAIYATCALNEKFFPTAMSVNIYELAVLNGTSSVSIKFNNYFVPDDHLISSRMLNIPPAPRPSKYSGCEIGISASLLSDLERLSETSAHPRTGYVQKAVLALRGRESEIRGRLSGNSSDPSVSADIHRLNRDSLELLTLASGARAIEKGSSLARLNSEIMLFDLVLQAPRTMELKIDRLANAKS